MAIEQKSVKTGGTGAGTPPTAEQSVEKTRSFIQETIVELKKTTWPTREEATRLTIVVVGVIVAVGFYMGTMDALLSFLVNKFSLIK